MSENTDIFENRKDIIDIIKDTYQRDIIGNYNPSVEYIKTRPLIERDNYFFSKNLGKISQIPEIKYSLLNNTINRKELRILKDCKVITYNDLTKAKEQVDLKQSNFTRRERNTIDEMYNYYSKLLEKI